MFSPLCAVVITNKAVSFEIVILYTHITRGNECILLSLSPSPPLEISVIEAAGLSRPDSCDEPQ